MITEKTSEELSRENIIRQTLEAAAKRVEEQKGNPTYRQAWKIAIRAILGLRPELVNKTLIKD
jgi:hypothetical protein